MDFGSIANTDDLPEDHTTGDNPPTVETFPAAGKPIKDNITPWSGPPKGFNPWSPFNSIYDFKIAHWFIESGTPQSKIDEYFNNGLSGGREGSFVSSYTLRKLLAEMDPDMGLGSWKTTEVEFWSGTATY